MRLNVAAGVLALAVQAAVQLGAIRVLDSTLGKEAVALFGLALTLTAASRFFEFGIPAAAMRAISEPRRVQAPAEAPLATEIMASGERAYLRLVPGVVFVTSLVAYWLINRAQTSGSIADSTLLAGLIVAFVMAQWPIPLYESILAASNRIPRTQSLSAGVRLVSYGLAIAFLIAGKSISLFFFILTAGGAIHALAARMMAKEAVASRGVSGDAHQSQWSPFAGFAQTVSIISLLSIALANIDKITVARILPLAEYSDYAIAALVAGSLQVFALPILNATISPLTASLDDREMHEKVLLRASRLNSAFVAGVAGILAAFTPLLLALWLGRPADASTVTVTRIFVTGSVLNTLMNAAHALQLAHAKLYIGIRTHVVLLAVYLPLTVTLTTRYGAKGAACAWAVMNLAYLLIGLPWTLRTTKLQYLYRQFLTDFVVAGVLATLPLSVLVLWPITADSPTWTAAGELAVCILAVSVAAIALSPDVRERALYLVLSKTERGTRL